MNASLLRRQSAIATRGLGSVDRSEVRGAPAVAAAASGKATLVADHAGASNPTDFEAFVREFEAFGLARAMRLLASPDAAAEATQEALIRAFGSWQRFRGGNRHAWFATIVTNVAIDELRRRRRRPQFSIEGAEESGRWSPPASVDPGPQEVAEIGELREILSQSMSVLRPESRAILMMADVESLSYREIAESIGVPIGTVRSRLSRSRSAVRTRLRAMERAREYLPAVRV